MKRVVPPFTNETICDRFPRLYHMAEADSWESIKRHGLLSTTALLDLYGYEGSDRGAIESARRPNSVTVSHPNFGSAVIRDNKPMSEKALAKCLNGITPREWYQTLNSRVFFWLSRDRLIRLLKARAYRDKRQTVITVDTEALVARYSDQVTLSPINSGSTIYTPQPRGRDTFSRIEDYPIAERLRKTSWKNAVAELAVNYSVPDILDVTILVEHLDDGECVEVLWSR